MFNEYETTPKDASNRNSSSTDLNLIEDLLPKTTLRVMPFVENEINNEIPDVWYCKRTCSPRSNW